VVRAPTGRKASHHQRGTTSDDAAAASAAASARWATTHVETATARPSRIHSYARTNANDERK